MSAVTKIEPANESVLEAFAPFESFARVMLDAYAVVDRDGKVLKANQLLAQALNKKSKQILKANSLDECIQFHIKGTALKVTEIINQEGVTRIDEVRAVVDGNDSLNLILGIHPFHSPVDRSLMGAFILIRDVTAETNLQFKYKDVANKSITDPLTKLFTRAYFEDYLSLQMRTMNALPADSDQRVLSLIMVDIDYFKKVNDVHGHQAGDFILQIVSGVMRKVVRKTDIACRYGGEEFLIILPATDVNGAMLAAEKLRAAVEAEKIEFDGKTINVTISSGIAQVKVGVENYNETMGRADEALYDAKKSGRNRVCAAKE
jgi:diguanylate cyclase (GGDEF)-like protein